MKAMVIREYGGPEVLRFEDVPEPKPAEDSVTVKLEAVGVNYTDIYTRTGIYPAKLPAVPGVEGAGFIAAVGEKVRSLKIGDAVVYAGSMGSYAEYASVRSNRVVKIPEDMDRKTAAAAFLQGITAHYLVHDTFRLRASHSILIHAAAGGVGLMLVQMAKQIGAKVIATTSTEAKAELAREAGASEVIIYTSQDFEEQVKKLTIGKGVDVVYDSVGKATFEKSLKCLRHRGYMVSFGQSSGLIPPYPPSILQNGSLFLTRPTSADYTETREELERRAKDIFSWVQRGTLKVRIFGSFPLSKAAETHRLLENRQTTGKLLLIP